MPEQELPHLSVPSAPDAAPQQSSESLTEEELRELQIDMQRLSDHIAAFAADHDLTGIENPILSDYLSALGDDWVKLRAHHATQGTFLKADV